MFYHEYHKYPSAMPIEANIFSNKAFVAHWHSEYELILVKEGSVSMGINAHKRELLEGEIAIITSGDIHFLSTNTKESKYYCVIFQPSIIEGVVDLTPQPEINHPFISYADLKKLSLSDRELKILQYCFTTIHDELKREDPFYKVIVKSKIAELLGLIFRFTVKAPELQAEASSIASSLHLIRKAIRYIEDNFEHDILLEDVAGHLNISAFYFSRLFSKTTGMTFKAFLNTTRINKAIQFLKSTNESITTIAYECGFSSIRTFNRVFKELKNIPPSAIRRPRG